MPEHPGISWAPNLKSSTSDPADKTPAELSQSQSADAISQLGRSAIHSSTGSLKAMSERAHGGESIRRAVSARASQGQIRGRRLSQSKMAKRSVNADHPVYPDQSFASLQVQFGRPGSPLRTRSSHAAQNITYNDIARPASRSPLQGAVTADNTPISSPGLFSFPTAVRQFEAAESQLHHLQTPKETHTAEIEHDTFSGNKFINNYEIVHELGRGEHGKVKLARNVETAALVAVKIVPRYSRSRRLGRLGAPEDRTKREVAILKKARHANVVSLLEVIDDPNKNKVYLILEYIERGEIKWRKPGVREVVAVSHARYDQERAGAVITTAVNERDLFAVAQAQRRHEALERARAGNLVVPNWSLEYGGEDEEDHLSDLSRSASRHFDSHNPSRTNSHDDFAEHDLAGSMYGAYAPEAYRGRAFSVAMSAVSHMSSEVNFANENDEDSFVPAMTLEETRRAFRDTLLGLEFLHFIGIIHRDIKPANLLVASNGSAKISDFGVSYLGRPTSDEHPDNKLTEKDVLTLDNEKDLARSVGTPAFWAPELCYEDVTMFHDGVAPKIGTALDLWALGITLYCMVYARLPFYYHDGIGINLSICTDEVFMPKTRLVPVDTSADKPTSSVTHPINSNKRLDYELKFEVVPEEVRDLIGKLLTKDPHFRITILEAKKHPWVVEGMDDPGNWIRGPDLEKEGKGQILEVDEREMTHAVGKRNIIERALTTAGRIAGSLLGRRDTRKRASSTATSSSESVVSPASTVGKNDKVKESRRSSLKGDEVLAAIKASRENSEHPLAQSQSASPDTEPGSYFESRSNPQIQSLAGASNDLRPKGPDRATSVAESVLTIRPPQYQRSMPEIPDTMETGVRQRVECLWEGTTAQLARMTSRDRRYPRSRSPAPSRDSSESDAHGGPSVAVSTASASGAIQPPDALRQVPPVGSPKLVRRHSAFLAPASTEAAFEHAQDINQRRLIREAQEQAEAAAKPETHETYECPPSPDDIVFLAKQREIQAAPSASTIASDFGSVSHSMSNPSFGMNSSASSPPQDTFLSECKHEEPDFMRTADTITEHDTPVAAPGKALEDQAEAYDQDDDSDEDGIIMGGPKRK